MTTTIGTNLSLLNYSRSGSAASETPVSLAAILNEQARQASQLPSSTQVSLSDQAKAYLAATANTETATTAPPAADAASMRQWFDRQYATLGTSSAMLNGKVAVDLTGQNRATLSAIADNSSGLFSKDESTAAAMVA